MMQAGPCYEGLRDEVFRLTGPIDADNFRQLAPDNPVKLVRHQISVSMFAEVVKIDGVLDQLLLEGRKGCISTVFLLTNLPRFCIFGPLLQALAVTGVWSYCRAG